MFALMRALIMEYNELMRVLPIDSVSLSKQKSLISYYNNNNICFFCSQWTLSLSKVSLSLSLSPPVLAHDAPDHPSRPTVETKEN